MPITPEPKYQRSLDDMVNALRRHLKILRDHSNKVFIDGDPDYGAEVAKQLRILATEFGSNKPLLIKLMAITNIKVNVLLGDKPPGLYPPGYNKEKGMKLEAYMKLMPVGRRISTGEFIQLSNEDLIRGWAEKLGGAHEDWSIPEGLATVLYDRVFFGNMQASFYMLRGVTDTILQVGDRFLTEYDKRKNKKGEKSNT